MIDLRKRQLVNIKMLSSRTFARLISLRPRNLDMKSLPRHIASATKAVESSNSYVTDNRSTRTCVCTCAGSRYLPCNYRADWQRRNKSTNRDSQQDDEETSDSEEEESDAEEETSNFAIHPDDAGMPQNYRDTEIHVNSLRADSVLANALKISRKVVDDAFLGSKLRLNNAKLLKKSKQVKAGDCVELIVSRTDGVETFKRVRINRIGAQKSNKDKHVMYVRSWRGNNQRHIEDRWS